jgi:hypothetical protein
MFQKIIQIIIGFFFGLAIVEMPELSLCHGHAAWLDIFNPS